MILSTDYVIQHTENWIRSFIIQLNLCPFAKREVERGRLRIQVSSTSKITEALAEFHAELRLLDETRDIETSLVIFPTLLNDFFAYLEFVDLAEDLILAQGYEGIYQLATFHPDYCFADVDFNDVSNYTNRSPYPMLHLLREESLEKAIAYYGDTTKIPEKNVAAMHELGEAAMKKLLVDCVPKD